VLRQITIAHGNQTRGKFLFNGHTTGEWRWKGRMAQSQEEGRALWSVPVRIGSMRRRPSGREGVLENMCVADVEGWLCEMRACC
jgi:hypothetical protein